MSAADATAPAPAESSGCGCCSHACASTASAAPAAASSATAAATGAAGAPLRIDVHTHILPENWPDLKKRYGYGGWVTIVHDPAGDGKTAKMYKDDGTFFRAVKSDCWSPEDRLASMDKAGIDVQVLSTVPVMFSYWAKPEDALDLSMMLNDHIARCCALHPTRFVGLGTIPMQAPELAAKELRRCVQECGLAGVQIGSHVNKWTLAERVFDPIWAAAEEVGACVFVHPWDMIGSDLMTRYFMPWLVGMPAETSLAICSMMFGGVFERFPKLRVCFAHGGGSFPCTWARIQHGFDVRPDLCAADCKVPPKDQIGRFWTDSLVHDADSLDGIVKLFGKDKVCLGSDAPFVLGEVTPLEDGCQYAAGKLIESMKHWDADLTVRVFGTNALTWLNREGDQFKR